MTQHTDGNPRMARRAGIAAFVGTAIELFDFTIYSTASALVLGALFFPSVSEATGTLVAFATIFAGFVARPLGGVIFGHFGDRVSRKKMLIITLSLMGVATTAVGLLPTYSMIGIAAPILLVAFRMLQGIAMGGEWGGAVLIATEHAPKNKKILYGAFAQQGSPVGSLMGTVAFALLTQLPDEAFTGWGWRVPFLVSALLVVLGVVIRKSLEESPEMDRIREQQEISKIPSLEVLRTSKLPILLGMLGGAIGMAGSYLKGTFALSWATAEVGYDRSTFLTIITVALVVQVIVQPVGAVLATRFEPGKVIVWLLVPEILFMPLMFWAIGSGSIAWTVVTMALATLPHAMFYATLAGILADSFPARTRYTGISITYQLSTTLFAGATPFLAQSLLTSTGTIVSVIGLAVVYVLLSIVCSLALLRRNSRRSAGVDASIAVVA